MQTIQFRVEENYLNVVLTLLNNLKINIQDLLIFKEAKKSNTLSKFIEVENSIKQNNKAYDFLKLGGSNCWSGDIEEMREDRIKYGSS